MPLEPGAINGGLVERDEAMPTPVITLDVKAIDDALKAIEAHGRLHRDAEDGRSPAWGPSRTSRIRRAT